MATPTFSAGGLASGLDSASIIDQLVKLESRPIDLLRSRQSALKTQVSLVGDLMSKLKDLNDSAKTLGTQGLLAVKVDGTPSSVSVTPGTGANAGRFSIGVSALATAAKARSVGFASADAEVKAGSLALQVQGQTFNLNIAQGSTLNDVATAINGLGAGVSASLISNGSQTFLSLTNVKTGFTVGSNAADALVLTETSTGASGQALGLASTATATNAQLTVDGLSMERMSNELTDVIPGVTLQLKEPGPAEEVVLSRDTQATQDRLQKFVDSYNALMKGLQKQLAVTADTNRAVTLAGDPAVRNLQRQLSGLVSTAVPGLGDVRSLADLGVKTARDGSLSIDTDTLNRALTRNPGAVNTLFSQASTGLTAVTGSLVDSYTQSTTGILSSRQNSLNKNISSMDDQAVRLQDRIDAFRTKLTAQFTAMENVVSGLKAIGNFLTQQDAQRAKNS